MGNKFTISTYPLDWLFYVLLLNSFGRLSSVALPSQGWHKVCVTRWWEGINKAHYTENYRAQNQSLLTGWIPPVGCTLCWAA